jgi:hypothetical protein
LHLNIIIEEGTWNIISSEEKENVCKFSPLIVLIFPRVTYPIMEEIIFVYVSYFLQIKIGYFRCQKYQVDHIMFSQKKFAPTWMNLK